MSKLALAICVLSLFARSLMAQSTCTEKLPASGNIASDTVTGTNIVTEIAADGTVVQDHASSPFSFTNSWGGPGDTAHAAGIIGQTETDVFKVCNPTVPYSVGSQRSYNDAYHAFTVAANVSGGVVTMTTTSHMSLAEGYSLTFGCDWVPGCTFQDFQTDYTVTLSYNIDTGSYALHDTTTSVYSFIAPDQSTWFVNAMSTYQHSGTWPQITSGTPQLQITTPSLQPGSGTVGLAYDSQPLSATGGTPFPSVSYSYPYTWSATNLPAGMDISYFTGEIYGLPAVAGSLFPTVTVHDFNGLTASKPFVIAIDAAQKKSRFTSQQREYYTLLAEHWQQVGERYEKLAIICSVESIFAPFLKPVCHAIDAEALAASLLGLYYARLATDPADPNYTLIALPNFPTFNIPDPDPSWTAAQLAAYSALKSSISTKEQIIGLLQATIVCVNRAEGAYEAGNTYWEQKQVAALNQYSELEAFDLQLLLLQEQQLSTAYSRSGFPDFSLSPDQATQFEIAISTGDLPLNVQQNLTSLGVDRDGLAFVTKAWSSFDPNIISGDMLQTFATPGIVVTTAKQLVASFITPFSRLSSKVEVGSTTFEILTPFTLGSNNDGFNPTSEDVSFSLGPLGVTIPAGSFRRNNKGFYEFAGTVNGISLDAIIKPTSTGYSLQIDGSRANLNGFVNPMTVTVQIGNDGATAVVTAEIQ